MNFQLIRLLEYDPFPAARWLTPAAADVDMAVTDYREDAIAQALDSIQEPTDV